MSKLNGEELANTFADSVNTFNFDRDGFIKTFKKQHRTLQQSMIRAMIACIEEVASDNYYYDGRNEAAHKTCKLMVEGWKVAKIDDLVKNDNEGYWTDNKIDSYVNDENTKPSNLPFV